MPASVTAVRGFLTADSHDVPLPSPQPLDLATDVIPYGGRVRFEVDVETDEPIYPLSVGVTSAGVDKGCTLHLCPVAGGNTFSVEPRLPWGLHWPGELKNLAGPPRLPTEDWHMFGGGEYTLHIKPWPLSVGPEGEQLPSTDITFRLGDPPSAGGAAPRIVSLDSGLTGDSVLPGQPWLPTATVEDADNDVLLVVFSVLIGDIARLSFMRDDGCYGDQQAQDGIYSFLRAGGDWYDRPDTGWPDDLQATFSVQALDLRGNWSEPATFDYTIRNSQPPVWMQEPSPDGPNILEATATRPDAPPACFRLAAHCDSADAWVCSRLQDPHGHILPLFDDGQLFDATAGDGIHSNILWIPFDWPSQHREVVFYATPKAGPPKVGQKIAVGCPPLG